jgi:hypothetical protein
MHFSDKTPHKIWHGMKKKLSLYQVFTILLISSPTNNIDQSGC